MRIVTPFTPWRWIPPALLLLIILASTSQSYAQTDLASFNAVAGTTFLIAYPDTTTNRHDHKFTTHRFEDKVLAYVYSATANNQLKVRGPGYSRDISLPGKRFTQIDFTSIPRAPQAIENRSNMISNSTFRLESTEPIVVYCYMLTEFGAEAWTPIPVDSWGTEYYAAARPGEVVLDVLPVEGSYGLIPQPAPAEILIIAAFDGTQVNIAPNGRLEGAAQFTVYLDAGQIYQVQSYVDASWDNAGMAQADIGGTQIISTKPIGVISGNTRAQVIDETVGSMKNSWKNMLIEWLAPTDQHGTEFIYMPTWDSRRPMGTPGEKYDEKRKGEFVRVYGTSPGITNGTYTDGPAANSTKTIPPTPQAKVADIRLNAPEARYFKTDKPAQAVMNSTAVLKYIGEVRNPRDTSKDPLRVSAEYLGWGAYMVDLIPREQWASFAPYFAPGLPSTTEHFINVVTDSASEGKIFMSNGQPFVFNRGRVPGTTFVWGTMGVPVGQDLWLEGRDGAKFYAFAYGLHPGYERYRVPTPKPPEPPPPPPFPPPPPPPPPIPPDPPEPPPAEHAENLAVAYGYPLTSARRVVARPDVLQIDTVKECYQHTFKILAINNDPSGLRSIRLDSAVNAALVSIIPEPLNGMPFGEVTVKAVNINQNARAKVIITDKTGGVTYVEFRYYAERVQLNPAALLNFGEMSAGTSDTKELVMTNPLPVPVVLKSLQLLRGTQGFSIDPATKLPDTIQPAGQLRVRIIANPKVEGRLYEDSLDIQFGCSKARIGLRAETPEPIIDVSDVEFGMIGPNEEVTRLLRICNRGRGFVTFKDGKDVLTWIDPLFTVSNDDLERLRHAQIGPDSCITISVTFKSSETGNFRTVARAWGNTRRYRDTSVWRVTVAKAGPNLSRVNFASRWVNRGNTCTKNPVDEYDTVVTAYNLGSSPYRVTTVELLGQDARDGYFALDSSDRNRTILGGDEVRPATPADTHKIFQRVLFRPLQERSYSATMRIITIDGVTNKIDTAESLLEGTGIESHITVSSSLTFSTMEFQGAGNTVTSGTTTVTIPPTRPVTVTDVRITPNTGDFVITSDLAMLRRTYNPGETFTVSIDFAPTSSGEKSAQLEIISDHAICDDSTVALFGTTFTKPDTVTPILNDTLGAATADVDFGIVNGCQDAAGNVVIRNTGNVRIRVVAITTDGDAEFQITRPALPFAVEVGSNRSIPIRFNPSHSGPFNGRVIFDVVMDNKPDSITRRAAILTGTAHTVTAAAHISTSLRAAPNFPFNVPVILDAPLDAGRVDEIVMTLNYQRRAMLPSLSQRAAMLEKSLLEGWTLTIEEDTPGRLTIRVKAPAGKQLNGTGTLMTLPFFAFVSDTLASPLTFSLTASNRPCIDIATTPGLVRIDSICGLNYRLMEASASKYALEQNTPNPFNPTTDITFSVGLDAHTELTIFNASGEIVTRLVDEYLQPGTYEVTWDATSYPSGLYYYRLRSGEWTKTSTMMLVK